LLYDRNITVNPNTVIKQEIKKILLEREKVDNTKGIKYVINLASVNFAYAMQNHIADTFGMSPCYFKMLCQAQAQIPEQDTT